MDHRYNPHWNDYLSRFSEVSSDVINSVKRISEKPTIGALIVEPRNHPLLNLVVNNFYTKLAKKNVVFIIVHGSENVAMAENIQKRLPNINLWNLHVPNLTIESYNEFMLSKKLWTKLKEDYLLTSVLIFQSDTLLLKDNIEDFLQFDYIGAPWNRDVLGCRVGNGGLSLRKVEPCLQVIEHYASEKNWNHVVYYEDVFFSYHLTKLGYCVADLESGKKFSCEHLICDDPMGFHKPCLHTYQTMKAKLL